MDLKRGRAIAVLAMLAIAGDALGAAPGAVLVFAAASTADAMTRAGAAHRAASGGGGGPIRFSFAASSTLARQIENGAPAGLFVSANRNWMDYLSRRGLIVTGSRVDLLHNRLVLIAPLSSPLGIRIGPGFPLAAALGDGRLAIADPAHVPAGIYARQALTRLGIWRDVRLRTARAGDVRAALALVERGEAVAGIVYASDAMASRNVRTLDVFPRDSHDAIAYPAALVKANDSIAARRFLNFLKSAPAQAIFARHGFEARGERRR